MEIQYIDKEKSDLKEEDVNDLNEELINALEEIERKKKN